MDIKQQIEELVRNDFIKGKPTFISMAQWYFPNSAGTMAMYMLSKCIRQTGFNSFMVLWDEHPQQNKDYIAYKSFDGISVFIPIEFARELCQKYNCIAIYTDHDLGNILNSKIVARWLGYRPGKLNAGFEFHDKNEIIFGFYKCFSKYQNNPPVSGELTIFPKLDDLLKIFSFNQNIKKDLISIYTGKKHYNSQQVPKYDIMITREFPKMRNELASILQHTKILYTFDSMTALIYEAMLCGCKVVIIDNENLYTKDDYMTIEYGNIGVYMFNDNIEDSIQPLDIFNSIVKNIKTINNEFNKKQFINFINLVITKFNKSINK